VSKTIQFTFWLLEKFGLAWNVQEADLLPLRQGITPLTEQAKETLRRQRANIPT
jgi:hypothetical protein